MNIKKKMFLFFLFFHFFCFALEDRQIGEYFFEWDKAVNKEEAVDVLIQGGIEAYKGVSSKTLGISNLEGFLKALAIYELEKEKKENIHWLVAKKKGKIVSLFILELVDCPKEIYIRQSIILAGYMKRGIGRGMMQTILSNFSKVSKLALILRPYNYPGVALVKRLGFQRSDYMYGGYDDTVYEGYEYQRKVG